MAASREQRVGRIDQPFQQDSAAGEAKGEARSLGRGGQGEPLRMTERPLRESQSRRPERPGEAIAVALRSRTRLRRGDSR
jgi:hypothetical protein